MCDRVLIGFLQWTGGHYVTPASGKKTQVWKIRHRQVNVHVISCDFLFEKKKTCDFQPVLELFCPSMFFSSESAASKHHTDFYPKRWIILQEWAFKKEFTSLKLTYPLHSYHPKRRIVSQTPLFRCYVRFGGGKFKIGTDFLTSSLCNRVGKKLMRYSNMFFISFLHSNQPNLSG